MNSIYDFYDGTIHYRYENPPLNYDYNALEPYIDAETMQLHHDKHLKTYIDNLNILLDRAPALQAMPLKSLILNAPRMPKGYGTQISNNAGGVYNHIFFFDGLTPSAPTYPPEILASRLTADFGSFENFKREFKQSALSVFGSGYAWLVLDKKCRLKIITTPNQQTPLVCHLCPILNLDVWEHAYYLKYHNLRSDYIDNFFNVINWSRVQERLLYCKTCSNCRFCEELRF